MHKVLFKLTNLYRYLYHHSHSFVKAPFKPVGCGLLPKPSRVHLWPKVHMMTWWRLILRLEEKTTQMESQ